MNDLAKAIFVAGMNEVLNEDQMTSLKEVLDVNSLALDVLKGLMAIAKDSEQKQFEAFRDAIVLALPEYVKNIPEKG